MRSRGRGSWSTSSRRPARSTRPIRKWSAAGCAGGCRSRSRTRAASSSWLEGAGIKRGARAHLWFLLDRPLTNADLDQLLGEVDGVDAATFRGIQVHYTAAPIFDGVDDPCIEGRIAVLAGLAEVRVPELAPEPARRAFTPGFAPGAAASSYAPPERGLWFKATRPKKYMVNQLTELAAAPAGARHPAIVRCAVRLFGLAHAGALDPVVVTGRIKKIAQPWGDLAEVDRILKWAWDHATPWRMT